MNVIVFLDWLLNHALPWLAPRLVFSGMALLVIGLYLEFMTDWGNAYTRD